MALGGIFLTFYWFSLAPFSGLLPQLQFWPKYPVLTKPCVLSHRAELLSFGTADMLMEHAHSSQVVLCCVGPSCALWDVQQYPLPPPAGCPSIAPPSRAVIQMFADIHKYPLLAKSSPCESHWHRGCFSLNVSSPPPHPYVET